MTTTNYQTAENIAALLVQKTGTVTGCCSVRMLKSEQLAVFGRYFGKGILIINGNDETVTHSIKSGFGMDTTWTAQIKWTGETVFDNQ